MENVELTAQLFVRKSEALGDNEYIVCGVIKTSKPIEDEAVNVFSGCMNHFGKTHVDAEGCAFDNVMEMPIFRKFR